MMGIDAWVYAAGSIFLILLGWVVFHLYRGRSADKLIVRFEATYTDAFYKTCSKNRAVRMALEEFKTCPKLKKLADDDLDQIARIVGTANNPVKMVIQILYTFTAAEALKIFRNQNFLKNTVADYHKRGGILVGRADRQGGQSMFERIRYSMAKNFILGSMCKMGSPKYCLTEQQAQFMADVMGDPKRIKEAASLMKSGVSKHEALAHSFIICEHQTKQLLKETEKQALVPPTLWRKAARYALIDGGYNEGERTAKILEWVAKCKTTEP